MAAEPELVPASCLDDAELAALFTAAYERYLVPFVVDENAVRFLTESYDLDRDASRIALRNGQPVGLANLGLRGEDAWIGGVGVVPSERRRGTRRTLMRAVQGRGALARRRASLARGDRREHAGDRPLRAARLRPRP
jgi:Acetyltransferase (GNAT) family